jgi:hypothetical protein
VTKLPYALLRDVTGVPPVTGVAVRRPEVNPLKTPQKKKAVPPLGRKLSGAEARSLLHKKYGKTLAILAK